MFDAPAREPRPHQARGGRGENGLRVIADVIAVSMGYKSKRPALLGIEPKPMVRQLNAAMEPDGDQEEEG
jgi:hypothetical protein